MAEAGSKRKFWQLEVKRNTRNTVLSFRRIKMHNKQMRKESDLEEALRFSDVGTNPTGSTVVPHRRGRPRKLENTGVAESTCPEDLWDDNDIPLDGIGLNEVPTSTRKLLSTGFLEGYSVQYVHRNESLRGRIVGEGILCHCSSCKGQVAVNLTNFEKHAGSGAKRPSDYIRFENGVSFTQLVNIISSTALHNIPNVIKSTLEIVSSETPDSSQQAPDSIKPREFPIKHDLDPITESTVQEITPGKRKVSTSTFRECAGVCDHLKIRRGRAPSTNLNGIPGHGKRVRPPNIILDLEATGKCLGEYNTTPSSSKKAKETGYTLLFMPCGLPDGTKLAYPMEGLVDFIVSIIASNNIKLLSLDFSYSQKKSIILILLYIVNYISVFLMGTRKALV